MDLLISIILSEDNGSSHLMKKKKGRKEKEKGKNGSALVASTM